MIGLCNDPEGPEQGAEQDPVRADQAAGDLFRSGGADLVNANKEVSKNILT